MKRFSSFIKKEFLHIFRDIRTMMMLLAMPVILLILFGFAIRTEIMNTPFAVLDESKSASSRQIIERMSGSRYFDLQKNPDNFNEIEKSFRKGEIKLAVIIPEDFSDDLYRTGTGNIQLSADASDPNEASIVTSYVQQILMRHQQSLMKEDKIPYTIRTEVKMLYNPQLVSAYNFVPGIMGLVLMLICAMVTSISIVREKEQGTMEILLVSPVKPVFIVLSKAIPYLLIAFLDVVLILLISNNILHVPIAGNIFLILFLSTLFILSALSLGMLISSVTKTQQAAMLMSGAGLMLPTILLSGLIFPVENMPVLLQLISNIIPAKWFITAIKDVMIKGLGFFSIWQELSILLGMTFFLLVVSIKQFKNRL
ncbi:MAG: ABC transporter permease [Dysgonamonadaceae bacterium]|jgi:ABC-2 type transport system permease protein|nr:ABC transporter permease [Dysgonamonadaceae bacterium]